MSRAAPTIPADRLARYDEVIADLDGVERKGRTIPYTSVNGRMVSYLTEAGDLVLRLPAAERKRFLAEYDTRLHEAHGTTQKEFVDVPEGLFLDRPRLAPWFAGAHATAAAMTPKPTRRGR